MLGNVSQTFISQVRCELEAVLRKTESPSAPHKNGVV